MPRTFFRKVSGLFFCTAILFTRVSSAQAADGAVDPTFGTGGSVTTDFGGLDDFGRDLELQPDGKILMGGSTSNGADFALARYNPDGSLDSNFDTDGMVATSFSDGVEFIAGIELQADGKILAAGSASNGTDLDFAMARYNPDGSPDTTFDEDGKVLRPVSPSNDYGSDVVLQPDGKILMSGWSDSGSTSYGFMLARFHSDGSLDTTFGSEGLAFIDFGCSTAAVALTPQQDGRILVAGDVCTIYGRDFAVARYNSDGWLDPTFDGDGVVVTDFGESHDSPAAIAVQQDGKIVLAGHSYTDSNVSIDFALARYNADGSLDTSFDADGLVIADLGGWRDHGKDLAIQPDGKLLVVGEQWQQGGYSDIVLARFNGDGSLDTGFGTGGSVIADFGNGDYGSSVAIQPDGRILVGGISHNGSNFDFALVRYEAGSPVREVSIDIKPNRQTNHVNPRSQGRIRVAILSTTDFHAPSMVDQTSLRFGRTGTENSLIACKAKGRDVNHDGLRDLICVFSIPTTGFVKGDQVGILTAQTIDGVALRGIDSIRVGQGGPDD